MRYKTIGRLVPYNFIAESEDGVKESIHNLKNIFNTYKIIDNTGEPKIIGEG